MAKVMISLPDRELARIDAAAAERGLSRSALVRQALLLDLGAHDGVSLDAEIARVHALFDGIGEFESADLIRAERDAR